MKTRLNMNKIAAGLGAERRGTVSSTGGYFGAMQLRAEIDARCFEFRAVADAPRIHGGLNAGSFRSRPARSRVWKRSRGRFANTKASTLNRCSWRRCFSRRQPSV